MFKFYLQSDPVAMRQGATIEKQVREKGVFAGILGETAR